MKRSDEPRQHDECSGANRARERVVAGRCATTSYSGRALGHPDAADVFFAPVADADHVAGPARRARDPFEPMMGTDQLDQSEDRLWQISSESAAAAKTRPKVS